MRCAVKACALAIAAAGGVACSGSESEAASSGDGDVLDSSLETSVAVDTTTEETPSPTDVEPDLEARDGPLDGIASDVDSDAPVVIVSGPCVEGMTCEGSGLNGGPELFTCTCSAGSWVCDAPISEGWCGSFGPYSLPTVEPTGGGTCEGFGANLTCTVPSHSAEVCACGIGETWDCHLFDAVADAAVGAIACPFRDWHYAEATCTPGAQCIVVNCLSESCACDASGAWKCDPSGLRSDCFCNEH
jgi:hypothetical protein